MRCAHCAKETPIVESRSYLAVTFGATRRAHAPVSEADHGALRAAAKVMGPLLAINWHGSGDPAAGEPFPGVYPGIEFNDNHPDTPRPPLVEMQAELYFCSTSCLRDWLNQIVDQMEEMLASGQVDTQVINPAAPSGT